MINHYLVRDLKRLGLWDDVMVVDLKHFDGSLRPIDRVPQDVKALYATAFEVETTWLVEAAARRQKWIDQAQSLNIYMAGASGKKLDDTYKLAWLRGLQDHLLPAHAERDARREVDRAIGPAQRGVVGGSDAPPRHERARSRRCCSAGADERNARHRHRVLRCRRSDLRSVPNVMSRQ